MPKPKPKPKQWENPDALIMDLRELFTENPNRWWKQRSTDVEPNETLAAGFLVDGNDLEIIMKEAVGRNTWRGFTGMKPLKPSKVFRDWAFPALQSEIGFESLRNVTGLSGYTNWLKNLDHDLQTHVETTLQSAGIVVNPFDVCGRRLKLLNLVVRQACARKRWMRIVALLHVPLDQFTIVGITRCVRDTNYFPDGDRIQNIPSSCGMGFVETEEIYDALQDGMRRLTSDARVPPIAYDDLAWGKPHGQ